MSEHKTILKAVRSKNFRSVGNTFIEVVLNAHPSTLVVATDNGAGKSTTTVHALYYGLFDKAYGEGGKKTSLINSKNNKDCLVEIDFSARGSEWMVRRGQKPAVFEIYENGVLYENEADNKDNQKFLLEVLGFDHVMFQNIIALGKDKFVPFIKMDAPTRRHVVENLLDLVVFSKMNVVAKEDQKVLTRQVGDVEFDQSTNNRDIVAAERLVEQHLGNRADIVAGARARIQELEGTIAKNQDMCTRLQEKEGEERSLAAAANTELLEKTQGFSAQLNEYHAQKETIRNDIEGRKETSRRVHQEKVQALTKTSVEMANDHKAATYARSRDLEAPVSKMVGMKEQLRRKADDNSKRAEAFRALGTCPTCQQEVGSDHKDHIAGDLETSAQEILTAISKLDEKLDAAREELFNHEREAKAKEDLMVQEHTNIIGGMQYSHQEEIKTLDQQYAKGVAGIQEAINKLTADSEAELQPLREKVKAHTDRANELAQGAATLQGTITSAQSEVRTQHGVVERNLDQQADDQMAKLKEELEALKEKKDALADRYDELQEELRNYADLLVILKDNGVKAQAIKTYIPFFNQKVNEMLDQMGMYINFVMDEDFNIEMQDPTRKGQSLFDLSTGQQRRIDLAILFAWREIAASKASVSCNLLILDEVLENLSESGVASFMEMYENHLKSSGLNLFVISQRESEFGEHFEHVTKYSLVNDYTREISPE